MSGRPWVTVGNHFYKDSKAPDGSGAPAAWTLLKMTRASLEAKHIDLKFEWPSPVVRRCRLTPGEPQVDTMLTSD
jgi:hypothetical protein